MAKHEGRGFGCSPPVQNPCLPSCVPNWDWKKAQMNELIHEIAPSLNCVFASLGPFCPKKKISVLHHLFLTKTPLPSANYKLVSYELMVNLKNLGLCVSSCCLVSWSCFVICFKVFKCSFKLAGKLNIIFYNKVIRFKMSFLLYKTEENKEDKHLSEMYCL